jgi:hypothetical protein
MIYMIGGAPRVGWVSTDLLKEILRSKNVDGIKNEWNASPEAIAAATEWSLPYIERFIWGVNAMADSYLIDGVDFLPVQVEQLSKQYQIRPVFLGRSKMTLEIFDQFPGKSKGYAMLPEEMRRQFAEDVPKWSQYIQTESEKFDYPYIDMSNDFLSRLLEAEALLLKP